MKYLFVLSTLLLFAFRSEKETITSGLQQRAAEQKKMIAVYFCGSDWCGVCHKFKAETLSVPEIDALLNERFVYYTADFPQRAKLEKTTVEANELLAEKLNPNGNFPLLVIADENWNIKAVIKRGNAATDVVAELKKWSN